MNDAREMSAERHRKCAYELIDEAESWCRGDTLAGPDWKGASHAATLALAHLAAADARAQERSAVR